MVTIDGTDDQCSFWIHHDIHVFPQSIHLHTHTPARTLTRRYTIDGFSNAIDLIESKGLLFHDQRFPLVCEQCILHTVLRRRENHKTFILTMALNKDYRHPRKFCIFRAKFVSLGPSIRLTLSPSIYPKRSQSFYIEESGLVSFSNRWKEKMIGSPNVGLLLFSTSEKLQKIRKIRFLSSGEFFISEFLKLTN